MRSLRVLFRVDASEQIGTGHVYRCLSLARALSDVGATCEFICREHKGNLITKIRESGFVAHGLALSNDELIKSELLYVTWLGSNQERDFEKSRPTMMAFRPDWVVVDHYGIDALWEGLARPYCKNLMVIDDLANRSHLCDLLLDQTFGRCPTDYRSLVPASTALLMGTSFALLRPEFGKNRSRAILHRQEFKGIGKILVSMGGVDVSNVTAQILRQLECCDLPVSCRIRVVLGRSAVWIDDVESTLMRIPFDSELLVDVKDFPSVMIESDVAVGAAGGSAWERCCMGLPSLLITTAENQLSVARALHDARAGIWLGSEQEFVKNISCSLRQLTLNYDRFSQNAFDVCDGKGLERVLSYIQ